MINLLWREYHICKDYFFNPGTFIRKNNKSLKSMFHGLVIKCDEIINFTDSPWTNVANTILAHVTGTVPINIDHQKQDKK